MKKLAQENIKLLKEKQDLLHEIEDLKKKKRSADFVTQYDKRIEAANSAKLEIQRKYKNLIKENKELLADLDLIMEVDQYKPRRIKQYKRSSTKMGHVVPHIVLCDWHCEEEVRKEQVSGLNEFNLEIAEKRASQLPLVFHSYVEMERQRSTIQKGVVFLGGDFFSGYRHEDAKDSNLLTPGDALLFAEDLLFHNISKIMELCEFDQLDVICIPGNHTRYTEGRAIHHKNRAQKTFEWVMYHQLAKTFKRMNQDKINFIIPEGSIYTDRVFDKYPIRYQHGNDFKYQGGLGGESIVVNKKILRWNKAETAYIDVFGHLHRYTTPYNYICGGSLIGYNQLALHNGYEYQPPAQAYFAISEKRGLIDNRPIYLEG
jgi:hypothetical protein